jgi:hypothetical protein
VNGFFRKEDRALVLREATNEVFADRFNRFIGACIRILKEKKGSHEH